MDSILDSIKKLLGIIIEDTSFDDEIILNVNSAIMSLQQLGIGPTTGFYISSNAETWQDLIGERLDLESIKIYIFLKTRLTFDPPQSGFLIDAITKQITELEWRLNVQAEGGTI